MNAALQLRIWQPPINKGRLPFPYVKPAKLLDSANLTWYSDSPVDHLVGGFLARAALESHLRLRCQRLGLIGGRYDPLHLRLFREGHISLDQLNAVRSLLDAGNKAVHVHPFLASDCQRVYEGVANVLAEV